MCTQTLWKLFFLHTQEFIDYITYAETLLKAGIVVVLMMWKYWVFLIQKENTFSMSSRIGLQTCNIVMTILKERLNAKSCARWCV